MTLTEQRERKAALFVGTALVVALASFIVWSATRGWWRSRIVYQTVISSAEGIREGTQIQMSGVRIGTISHLHFTDEAKVVADLSVYESFRKLVRADSRVHLLRPFVVGDKVAVITPGTPAASELAPGSTLPSDEVLGLTELLNGSKLIPYMQTLENVATEVRRLAEQMVHKKGTDGLVKTLQALPPLIDRIGSLAATLDKGAPQMSADFGRLVGNLASMTDEIKKVLPALAEVAPELPKSTRRVIEALDETVVVLKAMQKTFLLRSSVREVRAEEAEREKTRSPASKEDDKKE